MNILVVGDVHGCLHTLEALLEQNWTSEDILIQLGDLIDRGKFSGETVQFIQNLQVHYPERVVVLRENHEQELIQYVDTESNPNWLRQRGHKTLASFAKVGLSLMETAAWMKSLPLFWQNDNIFVSHAGISQEAVDPFNPEDTDSVLWTRQPLKNLGRVQIVGHTPIRGGIPEYDPDSNSWYIDTGACFPGHLSAIRLSPRGDVLGTYAVGTYPQDV